MVSKLRKIGSEIMTSLYRIALVFLLGFFFTLGSIAAFHYADLDVAIAYNEERAE